MVKNVKNKDLRRLKFKKKLCGYIILGLVAGAAYSIYYLDSRGVGFDMVKKYLQIGCLILLVSIISIIIIRKIIKEIKRKRYLNSPLNVIDQMSGEEFEEYLAAQFEEMGYAVELTPLSNDYGADLVCRKNEETLIIQAKRYSGVVGNAAVQEIAAAKGYYNATRCMVVTNSRFSTNAIALADANEVELWDRDSLAELF